MKQETYRKKALLNEDNLVKYIWAYMDAHAVMGLLADRFEKNGL